MQERFFDIGVNLTHESFNNDYKNVIENAFKNSVDRICLTGTSIEAVSYTHLTLPTSFEV